MGNLVATLGPTAHEKKQVDGASSESTGGQFSSTSKLDLKRKMYIQ